MMSAHDPPPPEPRQIRRNNRAMPEDGKSGEKYRYRTLKAGRNRMLSVRLLSWPTETQHVFPTGKGATGTRNEFEKAAA
jgi:hypothetical protein